MNRVPLIDRANTSADRKALLDQIHGAFGATPNMFRAVANSPAALQSMWGSFGALGASTLGAKLGEQIALAVADRNACDLVFTLPGAVLTIAGAHGMAWLGGFGLWQPGWIAWGHAPFLLSGAIWLVVLVPTQVQQGRLAASFSNSPSIPERYRHLSRRWIGWGLAATILPLVNLGLMVLRPQ